MRRFALPATVLVVLGTLMLAASASAGQVFRETVHAEDTFVENDFCGEPGLSVEIEFILDLSVHVVPHGPDRLDYFLQHGTRTEVLTNRDTGTSLTSVANVIEKDKLVTDNGAGTLTVLVLATGNAVLYGEDGKAIARNPGQTRFEILVDEEGAVTFLGVVKESTGRSDDFCEAAVPALA